MTNKDDFIIVIVTQKEKNVIVEEAQKSRKSVTRFCSEKNFRGINAVVRMEDNNTKNGSGDNSTNKDFFSNPDMFSIHKKVNPVEVLEFIKQNSPVTLWDLCKKLDINRNTIYYLMRDLEFAGLIYSKLKRNEQNRKVRVIYYNEKKGEKND